MPVEIESFRGVTRDISFDVYLKLGEGNIAHVFSRTTGLDYKRLASYMLKGVKQLYIKREDEVDYRAFIARPASVIFSDPESTNEKKIAALLNMTEQNMAELFAQLNVSEETAAASQALIKNYVNVMTEHPQSLAVILKLVSHGEYLYYHSIAVAIFSMFIARATGQFNQKTIELIGMGGFLHDIGKTQLAKEVVSSPTDLTQEQWDQMHTHPKLGLNMIQGTPTIPDEVKYIVYQHHEEPSGRGYPNGLHGSVIYYPAKVVAVADAFSALISKRPFRPAYTVEQAINIMREQRGKFDPVLVNTMASIFLRQAKKAA